MKSWRKQINSSYMISWLLVIMLVIQLFFQLQFHLHHSDTTNLNAHDHVIDFHVLADIHEIDHLTQGNAHELNSTPDGIAKKSLDSNFIFILSLCLLILFHITRCITIQKSALFRNPIIRNIYYDLAPPLRAPPAI